MKILIATDCYIYNLGGITGSVLALSNGLRSRGHEVRILSTSNGNQSFHNGDDYFIRSFPAFYYPGLRTSFALNDPLLKELASWGPDIIHVQTEGTARRFSLRIIRHCDATMVMTCHTDYGHYLFGKLSRSTPVKMLMSAVGYGLYRRAEKITVPSTKAAGFPLLHRLQERITVIPNGMELAKYRNGFSEQQRRAFRLSLGIDDHTKVLVSVSRLSKEKNIRELISLFPELQRKVLNVKLLIVGDGPDREHLEKLTDRLQLRQSVIFAGRVPSGDVWQYYASGDVFVSASTFEVHSMSYLEAMANGLPLLCREDDSLRGVLEHGKNGLIYHSRQEFVDFAYKLLSDDALRNAMARCSCEKAEGFSEAAFASSMLKAYEDAIHLQDHPRREPNH